jgi:DNA repair exonuclease SbcCD ATPase subunit
VKTTIIESLMYAATGTLIPHFVADPLPWLLDEVRGRISFDFRTEGREQSNIAKMGDLSGAVRANSIH